MHVFTSDSVICTGVAKDLLKGDCSPQRLHMYWAQTLTQFYAAVVWKAQSSSDQFKHYKKSLGEQTDTQTKPEVRRLFPNRWHRTLITDLGL